MNYIHVVLTNKEDYIKYISIIRQFLYKFDLHNRVLTHLKTLQRDTGIKMVNTNKGDKPEKERKYYSAGQGKPPIFIQAILYEQKMSAIDFFHITDAYLDWEKKGDDLAVMEPLIALLAKWGGG